MAGLRRALLLCVVLACSTLHVGGRKKRRHGVSRHLERRARAEALKAEAKRLWKGSDQRGCLAALQGAVAVKPDDAEARAHMAAVMAVSGSFRPHEVLEASPRVDALAPHLFIPWPVRGVSSPSTVYWQFI